ncbi:MAG: hypothetical protein LBR22_07845 [Desulfovibrio sp.]|jgi:hypothetical protein|nr:hypothetical protein [Desulfovibrio sp.]
MADADRKVFPVEKVLALVAGKDDVDTKDIAGFVVGRSIACECGAKVAGPYAATWLARWYPQFLELEWKADQPWDAFVAKGKKVLGDSVSLTVMDGPTRTMVDAAMDAMAENRHGMESQMAAARALEARVQELEPYVAKAEALQKKCDELEAKIKTMNTDMGALRRQAADFQGKVAISQDDLMQTIKDAIKDGLKGMVVGGAAAGAAAGDAAAESAAEESSVPDDFGFGASGANNDGFGF